MNWDYRASVIIPVYNRGHLVHIAFDSLQKQTIPFQDIQVIFVNDGSTDDSLSICQSYAEKFSNVLVLDKENGGLSSTRNMGLKHARGKYIFFLDDDDELAPNTILSVVTLFDLHYDEVDLFTYKIRYYTNGKPHKRDHFRYKTLVESGIYDLNETPMVVQTTINVCVKNLLEQNVLFRETPNFYMEDQAFNNEVLSRKMKIGYSAEGEYIYNQHADSIVSTRLYPLYCYDQVIGYFEELFSQYEHVPAYYQCVFLHNLTFRMKGNKLFPYQYEGEEYEREVGRIARLLEKVDDAVLLSFTPMDEYYRVFFLQMKPNRRAEIQLGPEEQTISVDGEAFISRRNAMMVVRRYYFTGDQMRMIGYIRSPFFLYTDKPNLYAQDLATGERYPVELGESSFSYYYCEHKCARNWSFDFSLPFHAKQDVKFFIEMAGFRYDVLFDFDANYVANRKRPEFVFVKKGKKIQLSDATFSFTPLSKLQTAVHKLRLGLKFLLQSPKFLPTYLAVLHLKKQPIWLYNDNLYTVKDNAYYQFIHDFDKQDGIRRYFIVDGDASRMEGLFTSEQQKHVVRFGSTRHKLLYIACQKILTSFCEASSFTPLIPKHKRLFFNLIDFEVIYLQHGILHATTPTKYSKDRVYVNRIVVSSQFEQHNFVEHYGYRKEDLIPTGMARYDHIDLSKKPKNRILYAPSWREMLIGKYTHRTRQLYDNILRNSNYFKGMVAFLTNPDLLAALEKHDLYIDFKLHPNFRGYLYVFDNLFSDRIRLAPANVDLEDYQLFITDFSSFNFDFLYLGRQLLYFVPDYLEFKSGCATFYRGLDLDFKNGFGDFATTPEDAAALTIRRIEAGFVADPVYQQRIDHFFVDKGNHCERLYQYLCQDGVNQK